VFSVGHVDILANASSIFRGVLGIAPDDRAAAPADLGALSSQSAAARTGRSPSWKNRSVGLWDHFVASRSSGRLPGALPRAEPLGQHGEWEFARLSMDGEIETSDAVETAVHGLGVPVIAVFVADSDAAVIHFAEPSGVSGFLAINRSYDYSDEEHTEQWFDPDAHRAAAEALARWAAVSTEMKPSSETIIAALAELEDAELGAELGERHILFAEEGLRAVLQDLLGLPLDRAVFAA
jgi:hypothetical protein